MLMGDNQPVGGAPRGDDDSSMQFEDDEESKEGDAPFASKDEQIL